MKGGAYKMAMFPVFIVGLLAGILFSYVYLRYIKVIPSKTKFDIQEKTIVSLKEDIEALQLVNEDLRKQLEEKKNK